MFDEEDQVMAMDNDTYAFVASQDVEVIVHQNLCDNESHIAKLRERVKILCLCYLHNLRQACWFGDK